MSVIIQVKHLNIVTFLRKQESSNTFPRFRVKHGMSRIRLNCLV